MSKLIIFCDGSSSSFGSAYCLLLKGGGIKRGEKKISQTFEEKFNVLEIELLAVIGALEKLAEMPNNKAKIFSDNINIIDFVLRKRPASKLIEKYFKVFDKLDRELKDEGKKITYLWTPRENNPAGVYLEHRLNKLKKVSKKINQRFLKKGNGNHKD